MWSSHSCTYMGMNTANEHRNTEVRQIQFTLLFITYTDLKLMQQSFTSKYS